jgi:hypothetical protein
MATEVKCKVGPPSSIFKQKDGPYLSLIPADSFLLFKTWNYGRVVTNEAETTQHGSLPVWLEENDLAGRDLMMMDASESVPPVLLSPTQSYLTSY